MRQLLYQVSLMLFGSVASAGSLEIVRSYTYSDDDFAVKDVACINAVEQHIAPNFRGLRALTIQSGNIFETSSGAAAIYPEVIFAGDYGDVRGSINCLFDLDTNGITDVAVTFKGLGLGGFEPRGRTSPSSDPADWKVTSFSSQLD
ncbi:MAG: hypothetical protein ABJM43_04235 [Paracoccaceae bacterium]